MLFKVVTNKQLSGLTSSPHLNLPGEKAASQNMASKQPHLLNPTASLNFPLANDSNSFNLPQHGMPTLQMGMGMSQNAINPNAVKPSKKRDKFVGDMINPTKRKKKMNKGGAKFI